MNEKSQPLETESVWDYPRPPRLEPTPRHLRVLYAGNPIADTTRGLRILETSHPPVYYFPPADVEIRLLQPSSHARSFCEWKGIATYWDLHRDLESSALQNPHTIRQVAWSYPNPARPYAALKDHLAFYANAGDEQWECWVDQERVQPQPGDFYGGWITSHLRGPFKGSPGTMGW